MKVYQNPAKASTPVSKLDLAVAVSYMLSTLQVMQSSGKMGLTNSPYYHFIELVGSAVSVNYEQAAVAQAYLYNGVYVIR